MLPSSTPLSQDLEKLVDLQQRLLFGFTIEGSVALNIACFVQLTALGLCSVS